MSPGGSESCDYQAGFGGRGDIRSVVAALTFDDRVLEALRQVVALPLVLRVTELVFGFLQLPLQTLSTPLLFLGLALRLLLQPRRHPARHAFISYSRKPPSQRQALLFFPHLLFLMVDVPQAPPAQVSARLAVGRLFDLSAESSQHGAEPWNTHSVRARENSATAWLHFASEHTSFPSREPRLQAIDGSMLQRKVQARESTVCDNKQVWRGKSLQVKCTQTVTQGYTVWIQCWISFIK